MRSVEEKDIAQHLHLLLVFMLKSQFNKKVSDWLFFSDCSLAAHQSFLEQLSTALETSL